MYIEKVLDLLSSAHEKWGQKQKCCVYNFGQCMFARIIRDPASPTEEVSISFFFFIFAICHFWNDLRIFERIDCVRLQQQVIRLYIFEYSLIIMVNARWLARQRIWSGRIENLPIGSGCSHTGRVELHSRAEIRHLH